MINRDKELEKKLMDLLEKATEQDGDKTSLAMAVNAIIALYKATGEQEYANKAKQMLDENVVKEANAGNITNATQTISIAELVKEDKIDKYLWGNAFYNIGDYSKDTKYTDMAVELATCFDKQQRHRAGYFSSDTEETRLDDFYCTQPFYMNYDTRNGGKEHYNDIIAQYDAVSKVLFDPCENSIDEYVRPYDLLMKNSDKLVSKISSDKAMYERLVYYAASLLDTMEVMAQPLYEIYHKLQEYYKVSVRILLATKAQDETENAMLPYVILKGCRMKALLTEKYEQDAVELLEQKFYSIKEQNQTWNAKYLSAIVFGYSEWIRNREYQDYGINKGGVLWS